MDAEARVPESKAAHGTSQSIRKVSEMCICVRSCTMTVASLNTSFTLAVSSDSTSDVVFDPGAPR